VCPVTFPVEATGKGKIVDARQHADHVYKHEPNALVAFLLLLLLAYNLFHALISLNVKPQVRARHTDLHFARLIAAEFYNPPVGGFT